MKNQKSIISILGGLTAFGPFVTDFYLASLPTIASEFATTSSMSQMTLSASMTGLAAGQLLIGPISDKYGRMKPLMVSLTIFVLATLGCIFSPNIESFIAFRFIQGLAGAGGLVISKVYITDSFTGADIARFIAILATIQSVSPVIAPVLGSVTYTLTSWEGIFWVLLAWGMLLYILCRKYLKETLPPERRLKTGILGTFANFGPVLKNGAYTKMLVLQMFSSATMFAYISASPFIFQEHFALSPSAYGAIFAINSLGLTLSAGMAMKIKRQMWGVRLGALGLLVSCAAIAASLLLQAPFILFETAIFCMAFCCGIIMPTTTTLALGASDKTMQGTAAAALGAIAFISGSIVAPLVGIGNLIHSFIMITLACSTLCALCWLASRQTFKGM